MRERDDMVERMKFYHEHEKELEHKRRTEQYLKNQVELGYLLQENLFAGKILEENNIQIFDLNQATDDFRKVMKLDEITEIAGVYKKKEANQVVEKIVSIKKQNFYNAFYPPIWKNLSIPERIKSLEWMFEDINESQHLGLKKLHYFTDIPTLFDAEEINSLGGNFVNSTKRMFVNLNNIQKDECVYDLVRVVAHELTHAKQGKIQDRLDLTKKNGFYEFSQADLANIDVNDLVISFRLDDATVYALYRVCQSEKVAELQALKTLKKYIDLNEQDFGKNSKSTKMYNSAKNNMLFEKAKYRFVGNKKRFYSTDGIVTNEDVILKGQSENLLKLIALKNFYTEEKFVFERERIKTKSNISGLRDDYGRGKISNQEYFSKFNELKNDLDYQEKCIADDECKIERIKAIFVQTLENGKLPKYFNAAEFAPLNILDTKKSEFSLPKWLRRDEMRHKKSIESRKGEELVKVKKL